MNIVERPEELVHVQLDIELRNNLLGFIVMPCHPVYCLRNVLEDQVEIRRPPNK